ncbi:MAG TPA: ABC transporter ATP-binding protein, partial [Myxococcota bacterium]|nr:ABC transporter ATP-binding protein [Myxococcota bacterium]
AENLDFFGGAYGLAGRALRGRIDAVVDEAGLAPVRDRLTAALPGGIQQRVALANALLHDPRLLFLDEPTAGVDPAARREFLAIVRRRVRAGATVFLTTHYLDEAEYCRRVGLMVQGRLVALGTPAELKAAHAPGEVWVVSTARSADVAQALAERPGVLGVQPFGAGLRVRTAPGAPSPADPVTTADPQAVIEPAQASLEDVFRALVSGGAR